MNLAELQSIDFGRQQPGNVDPKTCPACAMVVKLLREAAATRSRDLLSTCLELGSHHALMGHPWDLRPERRDFLAQTLGSR
ncbi:hypothetical protein ACIQVR_07170 [Streptomyces xanthochromogenes]|uniref:hypothetical protein n=1 Tax=Streptomyces xanthochromogenes TaxID=67384 RepID=UPI00381643EC